MAGASETNRYDAVVIGGGHNGLVTAAYLGSRIRDLSVSKQINEIPLSALATTLARRRRSLHDIASS